MPAGTGLHCSVALPVTARTVHGDRRVDMRAVQCSAVQCSVPQVNGLLMNPCQCQRYRRIDSVSVGLSRGCNGEDRELVASRRTHGTGSRRPGRTAAFITQRSVHLNRPGYHEHSDGHSDLLAAASST